MIRRSQIQLKVQGQKIGSQTQLRDGFAHKAQIGGVGFPVERDGAVNKESPQQTILGRCARTDVCLDTFTLPAMQQADCTGDRAQRVKVVGGASFVLLGLFHGEFVSINLF